jgi:hypothetical protein
MQIALVLYPKFTVLDIIGPFQALVEARTPMQLGRKPLPHATVPASRPWTSGSTSVRLRPGCVDERRVSVWDAHLCEHGVHLKEAGAEQVPVGR